MKKTLLATTAILLCLATGATAGAMFTSGVPVLKAHGSHIILAKNGGGESGDDNGGGSNSGSGSSNSGKGSVNSGSSNDDSDDDSDDDSSNSNRKKPRVPGGPGCDSADDVAEHPECSAPAN